MSFLRSIAPAVVLFALAPLAAAADELDTLNMDWTMKVEPIGDSTTTIRFNLTAKQFENWQAKYGQNQSLLKRDLSKGVSQFETSDWDVQEKQMDRLITISFKVKGSVIHKGGGVFEFRVPKQWRGGERSGSMYAYNFVEPLGPGSVLQNNIKLVLPDAASHFKEDKSETGDRIIQYTVPVPGSSRMALWLGLFLVVAGAGLVGMALAVKPARAVAA